MRAKRKGIGTRCSPKNPLPEPDPSPLSKASHNAIRLWFHQQTHLLLKSEPSGSNHFAQVHEQPNLQHREPLENLAYPNHDRGTKNGHEAGAQNMRYTVGELVHYNLGAKEKGEMPVRVLTLMT